MKSDVGALTFLIESAHEVNARLVDQIDGRRANFHFPVDLADGSTRVYQLNLTDENNLIAAKEVTPQNLPSCCPERHINYDGTFCIYWQQAQDLSVKDYDSAVVWWQHLLAYLKSQVRAGKRRSWPGTEWAHGSAAIFQNLAENAAKALGGEYYQWLIDNKLTVKSVKWGDKRGPVLRLYLGHKHLCSVWGDLKVVANKRQPCLCKIKPTQNRKRIRSCGDHGEKIKELIISIYEQESATKIFWGLYKGVACCGTMNNCPLKDASPD